MIDPADIRRVRIERSESDAYSTDLLFTFVSASGYSWGVVGLPAAPDIFEIKAHTLAKILAGTISLPRTLDFGFAGEEGRYVRFTFRAGTDEAFLLSCAACGDGTAQELLFDVCDRGAVERLLEVFRYLAVNPGGKCVWNVATTQ